MLIASCVAGFVYLSSAPSKPPYQSCGSADIVPRRASRAVPSKHRVSLASVTTPPAPELAPTIGDGRTSLRDGIVAERHGDEITVHFDTPAGRTRRPEKFEGILRATLPQIFGAAVDSALRAMPAGTIVPPQGLTTELPTQGLYIPLPGGPTLRIWPETRPGEEGPLVVRYRVLIAL